MVIESEQKLRTIFKEESVPNVILLLGDEMALISSYVNKFCHYFGEEKQIFDGSDFLADEIAVSSQVVGFFSDKRVFFIRELKTNFDKLKEIISDFSPSSALVMTLSPEMIEKKKGKPSNQCIKNKSVIEFVNEVSKAGLVAILDKPDEQTMANYIVSYCNKKQIKIELNDALFLIRHCGNDLLSLFNECDKLYFYVGDRKVITKEDISVCCEPMLEDAIFDIQKALISGNSKRVFKLVSDLIKQKNPPAKILSILEGNFAQTYKIVLGKNSGLPAEEISKQIKENRPWVVKNALVDASHVDIGRIYNVVNILLEADNNFKSRTTDEQICLENALSECLLAIKGESI